MFHPMVAGVTIPGIGLFLLMVAPFVDKNPSNKPKDRKFAHRDLHDVHDDVGSARHHRFVLPGPGVQLRLPLERRHLLRAVGAGSRGYRHRHRRRRGPRGHRPRRDGPLARHHRSTEPRDAQARRRRRPRRPSPRLPHRPTRPPWTRSRARAAPAPTRRARRSSRAAPQVPEPRAGGTAGASTSRSTSTSSASPGASSSTARSSPAPASASARSASPRWRSCGRRRAAASAARSSVGSEADAKDAFDNKIPFYNAAAKTYIVAYPKDDLAKAKKIPAYTAPILAGMEQGYVALYQKCVHLGCRVPWCPSSQWFECPCHGSKYNRVGEKQGGPAPRGLDRFALEVSGGNIIVDTGLLVTGPPIGTEHHRPEPRGSALCLRGSSALGAPRMSFRTILILVQPGADRRVRSASSSTASSACGGTRSPRSPTTSRRSSKTTCSRARTSSARSVSR